MLSFKKKKKKKKKANEQRAGNHKRNSLEQTKEVLHMLIEKKAKSGVTILLTSASSIFRFVLSKKKNIFFPICVLFSSYKYFFSLFFMLFVQVRVC